MPHLICTQPELHVHLPQKILVRLRQRIDHERKECMHPVDIRRFIAGGNLAAARPAFRGVNTDQVQFAGRQSDKITKDLTAPQIRRCLAEFINESLPRFPPGLCVQER